MVRSGRKRSPFCLELLPEPSPQSLAAPNPCLASPHAFISCPASFASFLKQLIWAPPTFSLLSVSVLFLGCTPSALLPIYRPQTLALTSRAPCGLALSKPVLGPAQISNYKQPLFHLTRTRSPLSTAQGRTSRVHAMMEKRGLPRGIGTTFMLRADTTGHAQAKHTPHTGPHGMCREQVCQAQKGHASGPSLAEMRL